VLLEGTVFAVAKLGLLFLVAAVAVDGGILTAWVLPNLAVLVAVNIYLFAVVIPRHQAAAGGVSKLPPRRQLASFVTAEYLKSVLSFVAALALPLLVADRLGLTATAHFAIPWLITTSVTLLQFNVSASFVVEAQFDRANVRGLLRRSILIGGAVTAAATIVQFAVAPYLLTLLGGDYAAEGSSLMRILALALPFGALNALYGTFAWMETRLWRLLILQGINVAILFTGSALLLGPLGISGVGVAFLVAQAVLGLGSIPPIVRRMRGHREPEPVELVPVHHDPDGLALEVRPEPD
jgi:O-antigen/teichoic acid export membrane protein